MRSLNDKGCRLCAAVQNPFYMGELRPCDTPFFDSASYVALPALGPLTLGHAMLVSRQHFPSLLSMSQEQRAEFESDSSFLSNQWTGQSLTFAEHGSSCETGEGPCIAHTHVNMIPAVTENDLLLEQFGHTLMVRGALAEMPVTTDPYFLIAREGMWSLYDHSSTPSQYLRQLLFRRFDLTHWDWRLLSNEALVGDTLAAWQRSLGQVT